MTDTLHSSSTENDVNLSDKSSRLFDFIKKNMDEGGEFTFTAAILATVTEELDCDITDFWQYLDELQEAGFLIFTKGTGKVQVRLESQSFSDNVLTSHEIRPEVSIDESAEFIPPVVEAASPSLPVPDPPKRKPGRPRKIELPPDARTEEVDTPSSNMTVGDCLKIMGMEINILNQGINELEGEINRKIIERDGKQALASLLRNLIKKNKR